MAVMTIVAVLLTVGISIFGKTAQSARRTTVDQFAAVVEQARTTAITRRKNIVLAIAPPVSRGSDQVCRFGLFEIDELPDEGDDIKGEQLQRWNTMPTGVIFHHGSIEGLDNLLDGDEVVLSWRDGKFQAQVYPLIFSPRGGLSRPTGSEPVAVKIGSGTYRDGQPVATSEGGYQSLRIGRVIARPWRLD